jgi:hypothetical protein
VKKPERDKRESLGEALRNALPTKPITPEWDELLKRLDKLP